MRIGTARPPNEGMAEKIPAMRPNTTAKAVNSLIVANGNDGII
jgi:hypothetical protein